MRRTLALVVCLIPFIGCGTNESTPTAADTSAATLTPRHPVARLKPEMATDPETNLLVHNGNTMAVRSVIAVLDPDATSLRFELLPFEPNVEDVERCLENQTFFMTIQKESPDPKTFPDRVPYATYALNWFGDTQQFGNVEAGFNAVHAHFIGGAGSNLSLNFGPTQHAFRLEGEIRAGADVHLIASGEDTLGDDKLSWNLDVTVPIRMARPRD